MTFEELMDSTPPMQQHALVKGYQAGFAACAAGRDAEVAELKDALGYDWDKYKASQAALLECMKMVAEQDAAIAELVAALEHILAGSLSLPRFAEAEAIAVIAKVRKP